MASIEDKHNRRDWLKQASAVVGAVSAVALLGPLSSFAPEVKADQQPGHSDNNPAKQIKKDSSEIGHDFKNDPQAMLAKIEEALNVAKEASQLYTSFTSLDRSQLQNQIGKLFDRIENIRDEILRGYDGAMEEIVKHMSLTPEERSAVS